MEILVVGIIFWSIMGVTGSIIMNNKGRSGFGGFALGVLLGPIGLIIALVLQPSKEHKAAEYRRIAEMTAGDVPTASPNLSVRRPRPRRAPDAPRLISFSRADNPALAEAWQDGTIAPVSITARYLQVSAAPQLGKGADGRGYYYVSYRPLTPPRSIEPPNSTQRSYARYVHEQLEQLDAQEVYEDLCRLADQLQDSEVEIVLLGYVDPQDEDDYSNVPLVAEWLSQELQVAVNPFPDLRVR